MNSKPQKSVSPKVETVITLQQKIIRLQIQIDDFKNKVLKLENKTLKQEQKIIKLQTENEKLKQTKKTMPLVLSPTVLKILEEHNKSLVNSIHIEPPEKENK